MTPDEILKQVQNAAKTALEKSAKKNTKVYKFLYKLNYKNNLGRFQFCYFIVYN